MFTNVKFSRAKLYTLIYIIYIYIIYIYIYT